MLPIRNHLFISKRYQKNVMAKGHHLINIYDELLQKENDLDKTTST